ncbi:MAG TPA: NAD(P)/FAD-dependent oxidoreductase [Ktedonobacterales bacterium]|nr:NAD(P)/FAD-dependent oxidoreductase [Ktedonobacterales bacterium]
MSSQPAMQDRSPGQRLRYAVLGGGALGLTVALRLAQRGHQVALFEREALPGGLAAGFQIPLPSGEQVWLEKFYHHLFRTDHAIIALLDELGLTDRLEWRRPLTVTLNNGRAHQLDSAMSVLRFSPIPFIDRLWMGAGLAFLRFMPSSEPFEGKLAAAWARDAMGKTSYDTVWGPLLKGKFGALADEIALPWLWARLYDRTAQLGYLRGGFQLLYNRLAARIESLGSVLTFGATVQRIERLEGEATSEASEAIEAGRLRVTFETASEPGRTQSAEFDRVISTLPTRLTCRLTPQLPDDYRAKYDWGQAYGAHCLILALTHSLTDSYWMNIADPGYPFVALVEHTNYMPRADYGGRILIYLGNYRPMNDPLFSASKEDVLAEFLPYLARINPAFTPAWVTESWMFAAPFAQPIVTTEYREHIPPFETPIPGLYVANMFQVYPHDRGQNYSVELAQRLTRLIE